MKIVYSIDLKIIIFSRSKLITVIRRFVLQFYRNDISLIYLYLYLGALVIGAIKHLSPSSVFELNSTIIGVFLV